jgi:succinate-acetate transporter protein
VTLLFKKGVLKMSDNQNVQSVKIVTADPSGLGLFGLAMVTLVASSQKLGFTDGLSLVIPWAIFLGASAQFIASIMDFRHNNTLGAVTFGAYAMFWYAVGFSWLIRMGALGPELAAHADPSQLGLAFFGYLIFTLFLTIGFMETNKVLFVILVLIDFLFLGLTLDSFGFGVFWKYLAGWSELMISLLSFYAAGAATLNVHFGKKFLPVGKPFGIFK